MEQLSCWSLFHLSPRLKVILVLQNDPWNFLKLQLSPPFFFLLPASLFHPRRCSVPPPAAQGRSGHLLLRFRLTWRPHKPLDLPPRALELPPLATPSWPSLAAATSPSRWRARCRAPGPQLSRAPAS